MPRTEVDVWRSVPGTEVTVDGSDRRTRLVRMLQFSPEGNRCNRRGMMRCGIVSAKREGSTRGEGVWDIETAAKGDRVTESE